MKHKLINKGEVVGIYFNNGIQAMAYVEDYDDNFLSVTNLLGLQIGYNLVNGRSVSAQELQTLSYEEVLCASKDEITKMTREDMDKRQPRPAVYFEPMTPFAHDKDDKGITTILSWGNIMMVFDPEPQVKAGYSNRVSSIQIVGAGALNALQR